ncbi:capsular exopolysaccharide synthesis family protein [Roseimicrobium gellanilyticum]|uniref:non-specific protein-tyrosine kinase n=1 Tax=Roseimicrobium gellanilyticum TaxID=748857 RepID=A0A366HG47_9BACT|nr:polysaccharide biosynthesis tyrosine autokinase [Roseimicrobium gellanilyticum]RBP41181.1 capsular exopolysaccharide synthesis family protein [Roseimicrobium gellanilyticum]
MESLYSAQTTANSLNRFHETSAKLQRYKVLLRRRWWFLLLTSCIAVVYAAITVTSSPQEYIAVGKLHVGTKIDVSGSSGGTMSSMFLTDFYGTQIELLESSSLRNKAKERVAMAHPELKEIEVDIQVTQTKGSSILNVTAIGTEEKYTQALLNELLSEYIAFRKKMIDDSVGGTVGKVIQEVLEKQKEVAAAKLALENFLKANDATMFEGNSNRAGAYLVQLENSLNMYETEKRIMERMGLDNYLRQQDKRSSTMPAMSGAVDAAPTTVQGSGNSLPTAPTSSTPTVGSGISPMEGRYLDAQNELMFMESKRLDLLKTYRPEHPSIKDVDEEIAEVKSKVLIYKARCEEEMQGRIAGLQTKISGLKEAIAEWTVKAKEANDKIVTYKQLDSEYKRLGEDHDSWKKKLADLDTTSITQSDLVAILELAGPAIEKRRELILPIALALIAGLVAGSVILLLFDRLDDRMNTFSEFQSLFPNESILGQIPELAGRGDVALIRPSDDRHLYAEAFRNLRSSILFKNWTGGKPPKVILVTSAVPNEGKTTSVANMAITMALGGARVLLADADLRRGGVSELFKIPGTPGFTEVLNAQMHWRDAVLESGTRGLHVLPRGEAVDQASELFLNPMTDEIIREMTEEYDYIIFDSAPVLVADDTASFAPKMDTVLFVVRMSSTMARLSAKALDLLYDRQVSVGGIILNRASTSLKEYTYYNYASYYSVGSKKGHASQSA